MIIAEEEMEKIKKNKWNEKGRPKLTSDTFFQSPIFRYKQLNVILSEILDSRFKDMLVLFTSDINCYTLASTLGVCHLT